MAEVRKAQQSAYAQKTRMLHIYRARFNRAMQGAAFRSKGTMVDALPSSYNFQPPPNTYYAVVEAPAGTVIPVPPPGVTVVWTCTEDRSKCCLRLQHTDYKQSVPPPPPEDGKDATTISPNGLADASEIDFQDSSPENLLRIESNYVRLTTLLAEARHALDAANARNASLTWANEQLQKRVCSLEKLRIANSCDVNCQVLLTALLAMYPKFADAATASNHGHPCPTVDANVVVAPKVE
eukprot:TRINITY_DN9305_c0_g1_i1.p1 TRINITY_DN9305_c0_g1~~TRINITY_DN9305_c0_g1_i1.p1  ORF type:complete len:238 (-),score=30.08 TRINITY_DN9305_c0_g1_i1:48-761(-)